MPLTEKLRAHVLADGAEGMLDGYLNHGWFSGAWFQAIGGAGDTPDVADRFTPADVVAVSTLSLNIQGWTAIELLDRPGNDFSALLAAIPVDLDLPEADDEVLNRLFALQDKLDEIDGIGHVTRSKLLARKRPRLVPIRDRYVLRELVGDVSASLTRPLRDALRADPEVRSQLEGLAARVANGGISPLRALDIIVWMNAHGKRWLPQEGDTEG